MITINRIVQRYVTSQLRCYFALAAGDDCFDQADAVSTIIDSGVASHQNWTTTHSLLQRFGGSIKISSINYTIVRQIY